MSDTATEATRANWTEHADKAQEALLEFNFQLERWIAHLHRSQKSKVTRLQTKARGISADVDRVRTGLSAPPISSQ